MSTISDEIRADFSAFADPATVLETTARELTWIQNGQSRTVRFVSSKESAFPNVIFEGRSYGYRQFFASAVMADLKNVAETQIRVAKEEHYIDSMVSLRDQVYPGIDALTQISVPSPKLRTTIIYLHGDAGSGKTTLLRHLAVSWAHAFLQGRTDFLAIYVDAQNRSLARLDEAVALVLQDIRAKFTYHALATLARIGLVVPIIDGFDELLGARGYDDALASLLRFLERLSGEGVVITSARSSFYKFQNVGTLGSSLVSARLSFEVVSLSLLPWNDMQIEAAITQLRVAELLEFEDAHQVLVTVKTAVAGEVWQLFSIPFFVFAFFSTIGDLSSLAPALKQDNNGNWGRVLPILLAAIARDGIRLLASMMIRREVPKLRGADDQPLLIPELHTKFLGEIAEEMWLQETRALDRASVEALLELVVEAEGKAALNEILRGRAVVHPLLVATAENSLSFRHELFFSLFIATVFWNYFQSQDKKFYRILGRAAITPTIADEFVRLWLSEDLKEADFGSSSVRVALMRPRFVQQYLDRLMAERFPPSLRNASARNAGSIVAAGFRMSGLTFRNVLIQDISFEHENFRGTSLSGVVFRDCHFDNVDLRGAKWENVNISQCTISRMSLSSKTSLSGVTFPSNENIRGIVYEDQPIYSPVEMLSKLSALGAVVQRDGLTSVELNDVQERRVRLLRRLIRATQRTFRFSDDDIANAGVIKDPEWSLLREMLSRHGLLTVDAVSRRGTTGVLTRFSVSADELEAGFVGRSVDPRVANFWRDYLAV